MGDQNLRPPTGRLTVNLNDEVWVRLTAKGWEAFDRFYQSYGLDPAMYRNLLETKAEAGWLPFQFWDLMAIFGPTVGLGMPVQFEHNVIQFTPAEQPLTDQETP